jgi:hypothetical protein
MGEEKINAIKPSDYEIGVVIDSDHQTIVNVCLPMYKTPIFIPLYE